MKSNNEEKIQTIYYLETSIYPCEFQTLLYLSKGQRQSSSETLGLSSYWLFLIAITSWIRIKSF